MASAIGWQRIFGAVAFLGLTYHSAPAFSAEQGNSEIVVTGQGLEAGPATPAYDSVTLERDDLLDGASGRLEERLASIAGFSQFRRSDSRSANPTAQGITLRALGGNASSRTLLLLDGVPVANPFFGYIPFSALSPERLAAVRVTRGGGSGAFGSGSVAGTIDMVSAGPREVGALQALAAVNDRGEIQLSANSSARLGQGFVVGSVQWDRGDGFWTTPRGQRTPASARAAFESWSASLRAVAPIADDIEIQASLFAYGDGRTLRFRGADSQIEGQQASLRIVGRGDWQFDVIGYLQAQDYSNIVISATSFQKTLDQRQTPTTALGGKLELRPPAGDAVTIRLGTDYRLARGRLFETPYSAGRITALRRAGGDQSNIGLFIEGDWNLGSIVLTAGARADRWVIENGYFRQAGPGGAVQQDIGYADRSGWSGNARGGLLWRAASGFDLRAAVYTGMRLPTLNELYRPFVVFPVTTNANPDLKPERLVGYEIGADWRPADNLSLAVTLFDNRVEDAIANVTLSANLRQRQNVASVASRGVEASANVSLGEFSLAASTAWTDATVHAPGTSIHGNRPAQVPHLAVAATLAWKNASRWKVSATLRHVGPQFEDDLETDILPAATTVDAVAEAPLGRRTRFFARIENLLAERIVTRNQGGSLDLGAPRTFWAGLRLSFP